MIKLKNKRKSLSGAFQCLHACFVTATNLHVAFRKQNFSVPSTARNILRPFCFSLLSLTPTVNFNIDISEELLKIWLIAAVFIRALAECWKSCVGELLAQRKQMQE